MNSDAWVSLLPAQIYTVYVIAAVAIIATFVCSIPRVSAIIRPGQRKCLDGEVGRAIRYCRSCLRICASGVTGRVALRRRARRG
jgi:hypothetical protein